MRIGRRPQISNIRRTSIVLGMVLLASVLAPASALASEFAPPDEPHLAYSSGIEPGSVLAGLVLPIDWSQRSSVCDEAGSRYRLSSILRSPGAPPLCPGQTSPAIAQLQRLLTDKKLYRMEITGTYDEATRYAVAAFHKIIGPSHSNPVTARAEWMANPPPEDWTTQDWALLRAFEPKPPKYREGQPDRVEVDIGHQVLFVITADEVDAIIPVSTGQGRGTIGCTTPESGCYASVTPRTDRIEGGSRFYYQHNYAGGWSPRPGEWAIYKGIFYRGNYGEWNYGVHGYRVVPHYPQSHGCIRTTMWDMDWLRPDDGSRSWGSYVDNSRITVGMTIHVWDS